MASFSFPSNSLSFPVAPSTSLATSSSTTSDTSTSTSSTSSTTTSSTSSTSSVTTSSTSSTTSSSSLSSSSASATSSSSSSTSTSSTSTSSTSSASVSSTPSSTTPLSTGGVTSASPTQTPTQVFSTEVSESTSGGVVVEVTQTVQASGSPTNTLAAQDNASSSGFFHNKGAVAGVFTVVGLIALAVAIALVTNAIRRRRAKKFDREIDLAAEEARKAAADPDFFDPDDYHASGTGYDGFSTSLGRSRSMYTDHTHGTYSQQPLRPAESYGMSEMNANDPYSAAGVGAGIAGAGMAGMGAATMADTAGNAGVGAAGLNRARSTTQPYNAFAGPDVYARPAPSGAEDPFYDAPPVPAKYASAYPAQNAQAGLFEAAGLGAGATAAATGVNLARGSSQHHQRSRSGSKGFEQAADPYGQTQYYPSPPSRELDSPPHLPYPGDADPYAGYAAHSPTQNNFAGSSSPEYEHEHERESDDEEPPYREFEHEHDGRGSMGDEEDYGYGGGRRVLKVANE